MMVPIISLSLKSVFNFFKSQVHLPKEINNIQKEALQKKKNPKFPEDMKKLYLGVLEPNYDST